jgi:nicotinamidase-related amidase
MNRPIRENLEVAERDGAAWVQCARCGYRLAAADEDWHPQCVVKHLPPASMGPHRELLEGRLTLEEHYCPGCGVTLDASLVEVAAAAESAPTGRPARRAGKQSTAPKPVSVEAASTAVIVLDLHVKACDPSHVGHSLVHSVPGFLERARAASARVIFIVPAWDKGQPEDRIAEPMARRRDEPVLYPHAYDKFAGGEMQALLHGWGSKTLIFVGGSANFSLLYTATTGARMHGYSIIVPVDGVYAHSDYEMEYALYQFTVLPRMQDKFRFTRLADIGFR